MSEQEELILYDKIESGLRQSYEDLLRRKVALGQDMIFAEEKGLPRVFMDKEALKEYEKGKC